jgi:hypothetical protein
LFVDQSHAQQEQLLLLRPLHRCGACHALGTLLVRGPCQHQRRGGSIPVLPLLVVVLLVMLHLVALLVVLVMRPFQLLPPSNRWAATTEHNRTEHNRTEQCSTEYGSTEQDEWLQCLLHVLAGSDT